MRYFLRLAFNGTPFHGWQIQPNAVSVQEVLEDALSTVLRDKISVVGAGRTDTGVNARVMYAHFDVPEPIADRRRFLLSLSRLCGRDIAVADVMPTPASTPPKGNTGISLHSRNPPSSPSAGSPLRALTWRR